MDLMEAIYRRRSVRAYTDEPVTEDVVWELLDAAIQAPSAMNAQPWAFIIVQDRALLRSLSDRAKRHLLCAYAGDPRMDRYRDVLSDPQFDIFYGAPALIVICAGEGGLVPAEDCCLAGQNLMLAAFCKGLGSCCIGWSRPLLNLPETKTELGIPAELTPVLPIIVGHPSAYPDAPPRRSPHIVAWR
ncbi:MAG TPA: nitroreductase family protein [Gammaproteobacteria bacterium]